MTKMWKMLLLVLVSAWEKVCSHVASNSITHLLSETCTFCIGDTQPERALASSEVAVDWIIGWSTDQKIAFRVAPMFVTDGKPNMQYAEFTEDLRDEGLEPWQPVVAH